MYSALDTITGVGEVLSIREMVARCTGSSNTGVLEHKRETRNLQISAVLTVARLFGQSCMHCASFTPHTVQLMTPPQFHITLLSQRNVLKAPKINCH